MASTLFNPIPRTTVTNGEIIGGRTGFTLEAGRCLVSLAEIDGREYLLITGGAPSPDGNRILHLLDALYIFDQL
jgi:D-alanyl-D-alanine carboxypeptidase (penicillin-binding protein 5/6)